MLPALLQHAASTPAAAARGADQAIIRDFNMSSSYNPSLTNDQRDRAVTLELVVMDNFVGWVQSTEYTCFFGGDHLLVLQKYGVSSYRLCVKG
jgi:hypothetical protein